MGFWLDSFVSSIFIKIRVSSVFHPWLKTHREFFSNNSNSFVVGSFISIVFEDEDEEEHEDDKSAAFTLLSPTLPFWFIALLAGGMHAFPLDFFSAIRAADECVVRDEVEFQANAATHGEISAGDFTFFATAPKNSMMMSVFCHTVTFLVTLLMLRLSLEATY